jgi:uncharacterized protein YndB with AHSA1/START domain
MAVTSVVKDFDSLTLTLVAGMPTSRVQVQLTEHDGGTRMVVRSVYDSREQMEQVVRMGAPEVFAQAIGQMDALLAGGANAAR